MQGKEKESHCTGSKGRRSKYLQLPISKRDMEKYQRERQMSCFDERKMEIPNFSTKNKTKKQSEIKGRKMEKVNK